MGRYAISVSTLPLVLISRNAKPVFEAVQDIPRYMFANQR